MKNNVINKIKVTLLITLLISIVSIRAFRDEGIGREAMILGTGDASEILTLSNAIDMTSANEGDELIARDDYDNAHFPFDYFNTTKDTQAFVPGEILIKFKPDVRADVSIPDIAQAIVEQITENNSLFKQVKSAWPLFPRSQTDKNLEIKHAIGLDRWVKIKVNCDTDIVSEVKKYSQHQLVEVAQANYLETLYLAPNDPYYSSYGTWGQDYLDMYGMHLINASGAWDCITGSNEVVVALVDSGVDYNHDDIAGNLWINEDENASNGIDDDGDGFVDNIYGADFVNNDGDPLDDYGHGTHCAGIIAAVGNNSLGVVGVNWQTKIMAIKGANYEGIGDDQDFSQALCWAADQGAHVISNSWGPRFRMVSNTVIEDAVRYAYGVGCVIVFAAGNFNDDVQFYSPQNMEETITVTATDYNDEKASFSNWGFKIDVCAPGVDILSLRANGYGNPENVVGEHYIRWGGTSMSCPYVAGLAALMLAKNSSLTQMMIKTMIKNTADTIDSPLYIGSGRINASKAIWRTPAIAQLDTLVNWADVTGIININGTAWGELFENYLIEYGLGRQPDSWTEITTSDIQVENGLLATFDTSGLEDGIYALRLQLECTDGIYYDTCWIVVNYEHTTLIVDKDGGPGADYHRIQEAVDDAGIEDTVFVNQGVYYENVFVDRAIDIIGENKDTTFINASKEAHAVHISANNVTISEFTITHNISGWDGIAIFSDYNSITENIVKNTVNALALYEASNNILRDNILIDNNLGIYLQFSCSNNIIQGNTVQVTTSTTSGGGINIFCIWSSSRIINNSILQNNIIDCRPYGIWLVVGYSGYANNTIISNNSVNSKYVGIRIVVAMSSENSNMIISNNTVEGCEEAGMEIDVKDSSSNTNMRISGNYVKNTRWGIWLRSRIPPVSYDVVVTENLLINNRRGVRITEECESGVYYLYYNDFINNSKTNAQDTTSNVWDNGYPSGGNYWDDHPEPVDEFSGPNQDEPGSDGIVDTPYDIPGGSNQDMYPLMSPYSYDGEPPIVGIITPEEGSIYFRGEKILKRLFFKSPIIIGKINFTVEASDERSEIERVEFYIDDDLKANATSEPYFWVWDERTPLRFRHILTVIAYDTAENSAYADIQLWKFF